MQLNIKRKVPLLRYVTIKAEPNVATDDCELDNRHNQHRRNLPLIVGGCCAGTRRIQKTQDLITGLLLQS